MTLACSLSPALCHVVVYLTLCVVICLVLYSLLPSPFTGLCKDVTTCLVQGDRKSIILTLVGSPNVFTLAITYT